MPQKASVELATAAFPCCFFPFHPARKQTPARIVNLRGIFGECVSFCAEMCYNESLRSIRRQQ